MLPCTARGVECDDRLDDVDRGVDEGVDVSGSTTSRGKVSDITTAFYWTVSISLHTALLSCGRLSREFLTTGDKPGPFGLLTKARVRTHNVSDGIRQRVIKTTWSYMGLEGVKRTGACLPTPPRPSISPLSHCSLQSPPSSSLWVVVSLTLPLTPSCFVHSAPPCHIPFFPCDMTHLQRLRCRLPCEGAILLRFFFFFFFFICPLLIPWPCWVVRGVVVVVDALGAVNLLLTTRLAGMSLSCSL